MVIKIVSLSISLFFLSINCANVFAKYMMRPSCVEKDFFDNSKKDYKLFTSDMCEVDTDSQGDPGCVYIKKDLCSSTGEAVNGRLNLNRQSVSEVLSAGKSKKNVCEKIYPKGMPSFCVNLLSKSGSIFCCYKMNENTFMKKCKSCLSE